MMITQNKVKPVKMDVSSKCEKARQLIDAGEYEAAASVLGNIWAGIGKRPDISYLPSLEKAEVLLIVGSLTGWLGSVRQIENSQEKAKDLICEAASIFEREEIWDKWAEARSDLAVCYWREGSFDEARIVLQDALEKVSPENYLLRGKIILRQVNVEISTYDYKLAHLFLKRAATIIEPHGTDLLRGKLYFHYALVLSERENKTEYLDEAIENYKKAGFFYDKANHSRYKAIVENNIGFLFCSFGNFPEAHKHLDKAIEFYSRIGDKSCAAIAFDSKAQTFSGERNFEEAERFARLSVKLLREGDEKSKLAESLVTLGKILAGREDFQEAKKCFKEAADAARTVGDYENAGAAFLILIEELRESLSEAEARDFYLRAEEILPKTSRKTTLEKLEKIGKEFIQSERKSFIVNKAEKWKNFSLTDEVRKFEAKLIFEALLDADGKVTEAARFLGVSHQNLSLLLKQRHSNLAAAKKARKPRSKRLQVK